MALSLAGCGGDDEQAAAGDGSVDGARIFGSAGCGGCYTLAAAGSSGTTGPDHSAAG